MLPKAHLTSYSKMSDARWVITPLGSLSHWDNFEEFFCVFLSTLLNIFCFCYVLTVSVLYCAHFCMKCSLGISNFLEEISCFPLFICIVHLKRLSCLSLLFFGNLHSYGFIFPFLLCLSLLFFTQLFVRPPQTTILPFCIYFFGVWSWSPHPVQCHEPLSIVLQALCLSDLIPWICLSLPLYNQKEFDLVHTWMA